jgi:excisionase family DNA binding protein
MTAENYLYVQTVAKRLRICERTVYNWIRDGKLNAIRVGGRSLRIPESALEKFLENSVVDPDDEVLGEV